jgi:hypothetical protein
MAPRMKKAVPSQATVPSMKDFFNTKLDNNGSQPWGISASEVPATPSTSVASTPTEHLSSTAFSQLAQTQMEDSATPGLGGGGDPANEWPDRQPFSPDRGPPASQPRVSPSEASEKAVGDHSSFPDFFNELASMPSGVGEKAVETLSDMVSDALKKSKNPLHERTNELEAELADVESQVRDGVPPRKSMGVAFGRDKKGGQSEEYKNKQGHAAKRAFREDWGEKRIKVLKETKFKELIYTRSEQEKGEYLPFDIIVDREGGPNRAAAVQAALNYTKACLQMQGMWTQYNEMTKRGEFLYVRKIHKTTFTTAFKLHQEMTAKQPDDTPGKKDEQPAATVRGSSDPAKKGEQPAAKPVKKRNNDGADTETPEPKKQKPLDHALSLARKVKQRYESTHSQFHTIIKLGSSNPDWQRWCTDCSLEPLRAAHQAVQDQRTNFMDDFLTAEVADVKKKYSTGDLEREAKVMAHVLSPLLDAVDLEINVLQNMHQSRHIANARMRAKK